LVSPFLCFLEDSTEARHLMAIIIPRADKIMKTLRNWEMELCWLHWKNFRWGHWLFFFSSFTRFTLSSARFSTLLILFSDSPCEKIGKWETPPILQCI
jgi:hypothetical protein